MSNSKLSEDLNIPLADDDPQVVVNDEPDQNSGSEGNSSLMRGGRSMDSIPSTFTNGSSSPQHSLEPDNSPDEQEEKARLISQVLELQNTLDDLSQRVDSVKEENLKLRSENQVLGRGGESNGLSHVFFGHTILLDEDIKKSADLPLER